MKPKLTKKHFEECEGVIFLKADSLAEQACEAYYNDPYFQDMMWHSNLDTELLTADMSEAEKSIETRNFVIEYYNLFMRDEE